MRGFYRDTSLIAGEYTVLESQLSTDEWRVSFVETPFRCVVLDLMQIHYRDSDEVVCMEPHRSFLKALVEKRLVDSVHFSFGLPRAKNRFFTKRYGESSTVGTSLGVFLYLFSSNLSVIGSDKTPYLALEELFSVRALTADVSEVFRSGQESFVSNFFGTIGELSVDIDKAFSSEVRSSFVKALKS